MWTSAATSWLIEPNRRSARNRACQVLSDNCKIGCRSLQSKSVYIMLVSALRLTALVALVQRHMLVKPFTGGLHTTSAAKPVVEPRCGRDHIDLPVSPNM